ncbi:MAG: hypothetical protein AAFR71_12975 [Pseudomonadota bacterium]
MEITGPIAILISAATACVTALITTFLQLRAVNKRERERRRRIFNNFRSSVLSQLEELSDELKIMNAKVSVIDKASIDFEEIEIFDAELPDFNSEIFFSEFSDPFTSKYFELRTEVKSINRLHQSIILGLGKKDVSVKLQQLDDELSETINDLSKLLTTVPAPR